MDRQHSMTRKTAERRQPVSSSRQRIAFPAAVLSLFCLIALVSCVDRRGPVSVGSGRTTRMTLEALPGPADGLGDPDRMTEDAQRGWESLMDGRFVEAEAIFRNAAADSGVGVGSEGLAMAFSGLGFALTGQEKLDEAADAFHKALREDPQSGTALRGKALIHRLQGRPEQALAILQRLSARYPASSRLRLELEQTRLESVQVMVDRGEDALTGGDCERATTAFQRAIEADPRMPVLHAKLADSLLACEDFDGALSSLEAAVRLASDTEAAIYRKKLAWLELNHGNAGRAVELFRQLLEKEPDNALLQEGLAEAESKWQLQSLPPEYRMALTSRRITRGELAALVAVEMGWGRADGEPSRNQAIVITDIHSHWANAQIRAVVSRGVMDVYQNHTFRPSAPVSRGDLAHLACRLLDALSIAEPAVTGRVSAAVSDLPREHRYYACVRRILNLGLMKLSPENTFCINCGVSGREALDVVTAIHRMDGAREVR